MANRTKVWIGIDPGKEGAIAVVHEDGYIDWHIIPLVGKEININQLAKDLIQYQSFDATVCLEDVHALFVASKGSVWALAHCVGLIEGVLTSLQLPYFKANPKIWQKMIFQGIPIQKKPSKDGKEGGTDTKSMALQAVLRLYPHLSVNDFNKGVRVLKVHDGIVDAIAIAHYCKNLK